jgi:hypothetical protein
MRAATSLLLVVALGLPVGGSAHAARAGFDVNPDASRLTLVGSSADQELLDESGLFGVRGDIDGLVEGLRSRPSADTLWIFDADFEDLIGDNAGWQSFDRSGTLGHENHWHKDTIRINGFPYLGDSTWWCGKYDICWRQPRGYGNDWYQVLSREFPLSEWSVPEDDVSLEWDQRLAMEHDYDYGYVDFSTDGGGTWNTVATYSNPGFVGKPGFPQDWDSPTYGHPLLDLGTYAGQDIELRYRFESDEAYSSQDEFDDPPHPVRDGAWQLDNIEWRVNDATVWLDDCESPGDNGWVHDDIPATGQTGVTFWRGLYGVDFETGRDQYCDEQSGWMYVAIDPNTGTMVDHEFAWLQSPPIDVEGATKLVGKWDAWVDFPRESNDIFDTEILSNDDGCPQGGGWDPDPGWWYGGPFWYTGTEDWDAYAGNAWLFVRWMVQNDEPPEPGYDHMGGLFLNRQRVGVPTGDVGTLFERDIWRSFNDWFEDDLPEAFEDSALIRVTDEDGVSTVLLLSSNDDGTSWSSYACHREDPESSWWVTPPPAAEMIPGSEIRYYYEATDGLGNVAVHPKEAPAQWFEMSILPITGSTSSPGILLVDKHGRLTPGEDRKYRHTSEYYYLEALEVLGYECDVYDVEVPSGSTSKSDGPDTSGMKYYDTQVWFTSDVRRYAVNPVDQLRLSQWLSEAGSGAERNLLLTGNNSSEELDDGGDSLGFLASWLATDLVTGDLGDTLPALRDSAGGFDFMTHDDGRCILRGGCPEMNDFDVVQPIGEIPGVEVVAAYVKEDRSVHPAGVAYTHDGLGYHTVNLGFGVEFMMDEPGASVPIGHYATGIDDRVDLMANIMEYFGKAPGGSGTGVDEPNTLANRLARAYPNPFNPSTTIEYSVAAEGRVTLRIYDLSGRVVRTLVDEPIDAGRHVVVWDGLNDAGDRTASGVYFVRMETGKFSSVRKVVLLK